RSPQMGRIARRRIGAPAARLALGAAQALPFPSACFDQVVCTFPTEYVADPLTAAEVRRVLAPGGQWVILLSAWATGRTWPEHLSRLLFRVTGQDIPPEPLRAIEPLLQRWRQAGFSARARLQPVGSSQVLIIILSV
ncbi:MAG: class I SAM-dependent methyltransferase, partial [Chloroflexota bacterium]